MNIWSWKVFMDCWRSLLNFAVGTSKCPIATVQRLIQATEHPPIISSGGDAKIKKVKRSWWFINTYITQVQIVITQIGKSGMNPSPRLVQCPTRAARLPLIRDHPPLAKRFRPSLHWGKPRKQRDLMLHQGLHFQSSNRSHKAKTRRSTLTKTRRISCLSFTPCNFLVATITWSLELAKKRFQTLNFALCN